MRGSPSDGIVSVAHGQLWVRGGVPPVREQRQETQAQGAGKWQKPSLQDRERNTSPGIGEGIVALGNVGLTGPGHRLNPPRIRTESTRARLTDITVQVHLY